MEESLLSLCDSEIMQKLYCSSLQNADKIAFVVLP